MERVYTQQERLHIERAALADVETLNTARDFFYTYSHLISGLGASFALALPYGFTCEKAIAVGAFLGVVLHNTLGCLEKERFALFLENREKSRALESRIRSKILANLQFPPLQVSLDYVQQKTRVTDHEIAKTGVNAMDVQLIPVYQKGRQILLNLKFMYVGISIIEIIALTIFAYNRPECHPCIDIIRTYILSAHIITVCHIFFIHFVDTIYGVDASLLAKEQ